MNKNDLIGVVADKASMTKAQAGEAVDAVFDAITASLKKRDEVRLVGFGTFSVSKRKASTGRNPATGARDRDPGLQSGEVQARQGPEGLDQLRVDSSLHFRPRAPRAGAIAFRVHNWKWLRSRPSGRSVVGGDGFEPPTLSV